MKTPFFDSLIDDFGIWQHTSGKRIFPSHGYSLDDAARGLLVCLALNKTFQANVLFKYLSSSIHKNRFYGFATDKRKFFIFPSSEDAMGQVIWAMGYAVSKNFKAKEAVEIVEQVKPSLFEMTHMRGYAYAVLGAIYFDADLAKKLMAKFWSFFEHTSDDWPWPEEYMTYGNGILPYTFLRYGQVYKDKKALEFGYKLLKFVQARSEQGRQRGPIGNDGWLKKGAKKVPIYSQQPIESAYMIWAWIAAYQYTDKKSDLENANNWMEWYRGDNVAEKMMYDPNTLTAYDGIDPKGIHHNSGAEANICLLLSMYMLENKTTI